MFCKDLEVVVLKLVFLIVIMVDPARACVTLVTGWKVTSGPPLKHRRYLFNAPGHISYRKIVVLLQGKAMINIHTHFIIIALVLFISF